eukprot:TRINITY_DN3576_c0_g1_i2.p1 TRINITY_DN3576_c0_g1~~TRINITY_DN3576_c0_g1_i2.p1  ORF type:complete len:506 (-),score=53.96 TRINITY_DN3576_c0_g1_i2:8-1525(-)
MAHANPHITEVDGVLTVSAEHLEHTCIRCGAANPQHRLPCFKRVVHALCQDCCEFYQGLKSMRTSSRAVRCPVCSPEAKHGWNSLLNIVPSTHAKPSPPAQPVSTGRVGRPRIHNSGSPDGRASNPARVLEGEEESHEDDPLLLRRRPGQHSAVPASQAGEPADATNTLPLADTSEPAEPPSALTPGVSKVKILPVRVSRNLPPKPAPADPPDDFARPQRRARRATAATAAQTHLIIGSASGGPTTRKRPRLSESEAVEPAEAAAPAPATKAEPSVGPSSQPHTVVASEFIHSARPLPIPDFFAPAPPQVWRRAAEDFFASPHVESVVPQLFSGSVGREEALTIFPTAPPKMIPTDVKPLGTATLHVGFHKFVGVAFFPHPQGPKAGVVGQVPNHRSLLLLSSTDVSLVALPTYADLPLMAQGRICTKEVSPTFLLTDLTKDTLAILLSATDTLIDISSVPVARRDVAALWSSHTPLVLPTLSPYFNNGTILPLPHAVFGGNWPA